MKEIRWHGRGGQGAKTASQLLADINLQEGKFVQSFPEYGPERSGAPIRAYNRVSDEKIRVHSGVDEPEVVAVVDPTLLQAANPTEGLSEDGVFLVNTPKSLDEVKDETGFTGEVLTIDATQIAEDAGSGYANVPMLGALVSVLGTDYEVAEAEVDKALSKKLPDEIVEMNLQAFKVGYETLS
ncbi:2-oxoacid:acceptor oxidoreductase family protein [Candidatus Bipolaricaulota bacterium]|nr:2-oxoacid:acceptor oxidoreductase family protein [Candidatus Bipolaricaulota bacterium]